MQLIRFQDDLNFLNQHTRVILLKEANPNAQVAVCPAYQGRVMTSTLEGNSGPGLGWINRPFIGAQTPDPHFKNYGGEDRFWLGPEGGPYAIFFKKGDPFDMDHWFTPRDLNIGPFEVVNSAADHVTMRRAMRIENRAGTLFELEVNREISILSKTRMMKYLGLKVPAGLKAVAYQSRNRITNTGRKGWMKKDGLLSIWILGMFPPSGHTTVVVPLVVGPESKPGPMVNDRYFGRIPSDRLAVRPGHIFFKVDGNCRSKLGVSRPRSKPVLGSFDVDNGILTIVQFTLPKAGDYVSSLWEEAGDPYGGDVINSYNDGPAVPGKPSLGGFYELETSSPVAALKPRASLSHIHRTFHFQGNPDVLDAVARRVLGTGVDEIKRVF